MNEGKLKVLSSLLIVIPFLGTGEALWYEPRDKCLFFHAQTQKIISTPDENE
jgi:hypothetical protein